MNQVKPATEERLAYLFLKEVGSIIASGKTYSKTHDALIEYLAEVRLYGKRSDFHTATRFPDKNVINGGAIIDHEAARERRFVADEK
jgi:hypothetical protein